MVPFLVTIRTANRAPKRNYLGATVRSFLAGGCDPSLIHVFPTHPDVHWLSRELDGVPALQIHVPERARASNANGVAQVTALDAMDAEWIGLFEDDLETCADPVGSITRWLSVHADPAVHVYRLFALPGTPARRAAAHADRYPLWEMRGSQAVILRAADARAFAAWATAHATDWRPATAPYQDHPLTRGFDKLIGYWALATWPEQPYGLLSNPMMVRHVGRESSLYPRGVTNDAAFAGAGWSFGSP
jgi:hypothetical protein